MRWCKERDCNDVGVHCGDLAASHKQYSDLREEFGDTRVRVIRYITCRTVLQTAECALMLMVCRYEDLVQQPETQSKALLRWAGVEWTEQVRRYVHTHTTR